MPGEVLRRSMERLASLVVEDGGVTWGSRAAAFQWEFARAVLDPDETVQQFWAERCRGANKTTDLAAIVLVLLDVQAPAGARCYSGAMDGDQAAELVDHARLIAQRSGLSRVFEITDRVIRHRAKDATLTALAADGSAIGKDAWLLVIDELGNFEETRRAKKFWTALISGARKREGCRTVVISNAPEAESWTFSVRETARKSPRWLWQSVPAPLPWQTDEDIEALRENLIEPDFRRLILNEVTSGEDALASRDDVAACCVLPGPMDRDPAYRYVLTVDLATTIDNAVASVLHAEDDGGFRRVVCDRMEVWTPRKGKPVPHAEVEQWVRDWGRAYGAEVVFDPAEARGLLQRLQADGIRARAWNFTASSVGKLGVALHRALRDRRILLPDDRALIEELVRVRLRHSGPGLWRLDHVAGGHDDRAVSLALGVVTLLDGRQDEPGAWTAAYGMRHCGGCRQLYGKWHGVCPHCGEPAGAEVAGGEIAVPDPLPEPGGYAAAFELTTCERGHVWSAAYHAQCPRCRPDMAGFRSASRAGVPR